MKALVFQGAGRIAWQEVPDPVVKDADDAVIRVDAVTICGTDLHIIKGDVPEVTPGRALGHEAVGTVVEAGADVRTVRPGDRVLISCISACGRCRFCREGRYGQCRGGGGWVLGHTIDEDLWSRDITITTGLVDTYSTPVLLGMLAAGRLPSSSLITHRFELGQMEEAYDVFSRAADTGALKVVLGGPQHNEIIAPAQP
ncbi:alcohol dehydrogenase catalytic domain-containing protein [Streptomyces sp. NPDC001880]